MSKQTNATIELMLQHRSIRQFSEQTVPQALVEQLILAGQAASSSSFVQATSVIQVSRPELREQLQIASGNQTYVGSCPVFLVFCADLKRNQQICKVNGINMPTGFTEQALIASIDTAIMAQNVLLAAESAGLGGVYMDKDRRESPGGWDQKFLKWVKKEHIQQQTAAARAQQQGQTRNYAQNEEARYHAREQRQQLTDAVLDLGNTDW